jgi:23S rRNA pseudouridine2457 synthase
MQNSAERYFILHKPYDMVSQFVSSHEVRVLGDLGYDFPEGTHAVGRLDINSEGLLILTTDKRVTRLLFQSKVPHRRTYLVKVKYAVSAESLERLRKGVTIRVRGGGYYVTAPCEAEVIPEPVGVFGPVAPSGVAGLPGSAGSHGTAGSPGTAGPFDPAPARKDYFPVTWLRITLTEGKFHQLRKMVDAVGHRCMRLIRVSIEELSLAGLAAGGVREVEQGPFFEQLNITFPPL